MSTLYNRRFLLRSRPEGDFVPANLERVVEPVPELEPGQALVRNRYLSLDPTNRGWMADEDSYLPVIPLGQVMRGIAVGEVVQSKNSKYKVGNKVTGMLGWQDYAVIGKSDLMPPQVVPGFVPMETTFGALGHTGMTAYFGLLDVGKVKRGETVFISAAAGAVGSIAGQIAKLYGARVVGIAGNREKCDWLTGELGFDAAICRRDADWREQLVAACPNGIQLNFENVGGEIMEAVLDLMTLHGRIVLCGIISQYSKTRQDHLGPKNFDLIITKRLKIQGLIITDYLSRMALPSLRMLWWLKTGKIKERRTIVKGLDNAPDALVGLFNGENIGKMLIEIDEP